jgi:cytochrome c biogenesis factor
VSREAAFMVNNWILLFSAFFVLFATMFPTLSEAIRHERLTVATTFFDQWMLPIGLLMLLLTVSVRCSHGASRRSSTCATSSCFQPGSGSWSAASWSRSA